MSKPSGGSISPSSRSGSSVSNYVPNVHSYYDSNSSIHGTNYYSAQTCAQPPASHPMAYASELTAASVTSPRFTGSVVPHTASANAYSGVSAQEDVHPPLFDPKCLRRPNPLFMISFIDAFFHHGGDEFGFLYYDDIVRLFFQDDLSYLLATCIAAWAVRYNTIPEFSRIDGRLISSKYVAHAKELLASTGYVPCLASLHSVIILAWLRSDKLEEFYSYAKLASDMLRDVQGGGSMAIANIDQVTLDRTWSSVNHLVTVASEEPRCSIFHLRRETDFHSMMSGKTQQSSQTH